MAEILDVGDSNPDGSPLDAKQRLWQRVGEERASKARKEELAEVDRLMAVKRTRVSDTLRRKLDQNVLNKQHFGPRVLEAVEERPKKTQLGEKAKQWRRDRDSHAESKREERAREKEEKAREREERVRERREDKAKEREQRAREKEEKARERGRSSTQEHTPRRRSRRGSRKEVRGEGIQERVRADKTQELSELNQLGIVQKHTRDRKMHTHAQHMFNHRIRVKPSPSDTAGARKSSSMLITGVGEEEEGAGMEKAAVEMVRKQSRLVLDNFLKIPSKKKRVLNRLSSMQIRDIGRAELIRSQTKQREYEYYHGKQGGGGGGARGGGRRERRPRSEGEALSEEAFTNGQFGSDGAIASSSASTVHVMTRRTSKSSPSLLSDKEGGTEQPPTPGKTAEVPLDFTLGTPTDEDDPPSLSLSQPSSLRKVRFLHDQAKAKEEEAEAEEEEEEGEEEASPQADDECATQPLPPPPDLLLLARDRLAAPSDAERDGTTPAEQGQRSSMAVPVGDCLVPDEATGLSAQENGTDEMTGLSAEENLVLAKSAPVRKWPHLHVDLTKCSSIVSDGDSPLSTGLLAAGFAGGPVPPTHIPSPSSTPLSPPPNTAPLSQPLSTSVAPPTSSALPPSFAHHNGSLPSGPPPQSASALRLPLVSCNGLDGGTSPLLWLSPTVRPSSPLSPNRSISVDSYLAPGGSEEEDDASTSSHPHSHTLSVSTSFDGGWSGKTPSPRSKISRRVSSPLASFDGDDGDKYGRQMSVCTRHTPHGYYREVEINPFEINFRRSISHNGSKEASSEEEEDEEGSVSDIMSPISDPSDFGSVEHSRQSSVFEEREEEVPARLLNDPRYKRLTVERGRRPTNSEFISHILTCIGDDIDTKYEKQLNQAFDAVWLEVVKDKLMSWKQFSSAAKKLLIQGHQIQDGILLIPCFARRLMEFFPDFYGTISDYTQSVIDQYAEDFLLQNGGWVPMLDSYSPSEVDADDYYNAWGDETIAEDCYHRGEEWHSGPQTRDLSLAECPPVQVLPLATPHGHAPCPDVTLRPAPPSGSEVSVPFNLSPKNQYLFAPIMCEPDIFVYSPAFGGHRAMRRHSVEVLLTEESCDDHVDGECGPLRTRSSSFSDSISSASMTSAANLRRQSVFRYPTPMTPMTPMTPGTSVPSLRSASGAELRSTSSVISIGGHQPVVLEHVEVVPGPLGKPLTNYTSRQSSQASSGADMGSSLSLSGWLVSDQPNGKRSPSPGPILIRRTTGHSRSSSTVSLPPAPRESGAEKTGTELVLPCALRSGTGSSDGYMDSLHYEPEGGAAESEAGSQGDVVGTDGSGEVRGWRAVPGLEAVRRASASVVELAPAWLLPAVALALLVLLSQRT